MQNTPQDIALVRSWINSPIKFVKDIFGYDSQPLICGFITSPQHTHIVKCFAPFAGEKMMTWQQFLILEAVENALRAKTPEDKNNYSPPPFFPTRHRNT